MTSEAQDNKELKKLSPEERRDQIKKRSEVATHVKKYAMHYAAKALLINNFCMLISFYLVYRIGQRSMIESLQEVEGYYIEQAVFAVAACLLAYLSKKVNEESVFKIEDKFKKTFSGKV